MLDISPGDFSLFPHRPVLLDNGLLETVHKFLSHFQEGDNEIGHPEHFILTKLNVSLKARYFLHLFFKFVLELIVLRIGLASDYLIV